MTSDGTYNYTYDNEGNVLTKTDISTSESVEYTWDHRNRLVKVTFKNSGGTATKIVEYAYDFLGRMVERSVDADADSSTDERRMFAHDAGQVVLHFAHQSASDLSVSDLLRRYLWNVTAVDSLLADETIDGTQTADDILWPLADYLNSTRDVVRYNSATDTTSATNHLTYDAFGNVTSETSTAASDDTQFHHTGKILDEHTGLQWHQHRWYNPETGRWQSADPIGFTAGDVNLYRYVGNAPQHNVDPTGNEEIDLEPEYPISDPSGVVKWAATLIGQDFAGQLPNGQDWAPSVTWEVNLFGGYAELSGGAEKTSETTETGILWAGIEDKTDACGNRHVFHKYRTYSAVYKRRTGYHFSVKFAAVKTPADALLKQFSILWSIKRFDIVEATYSFTGDDFFKGLELTCPEDGSSPNDYSFDVDNELLLLTLKLGDIASGKVYNKVTNKIDIKKANLGQGTVPNDIWDVLKTLEPKKPEPITPGTPASQ